MKTEEDHLKIEIVDSPFVTMLAYYLYVEICDLIQLYLRCTLKGCQHKKNNRQLSFKIQGWNSPTKALSYLGPWLVFFQCKTLLFAKPGIEVLVKLNKGVFFIWLKPRGFRWYCKEIFISMLYLKHYSLIHSCFHYYPIQIL